MHLNNKNIFKKLIVIALSALIASACYYTLLQQENKHRNKLLEEKSGEYVHLINASIEKAFQILVTENSFFQTEGRKVTPEEYATFNRSIIENNKEILAIHWAPVVTKSQLGSFIEKAIKIHPNFKITTAKDDREIVPNKQAEQHFPILLTAPFKANQKLIGFDPYSLYDRRETIRHAIQENRISVSNPINLLQNLNIKGVLVIHPLFENDKLKGIHIIALNIKELIYNALKPMGVIRDHITIYDNTNPRNPVEIYNNHRKISQAEKSFSHTLHLPDRNWEIIITGEHGKDADHQFYETTVFAFCCILFFACLYLGFVIIRISVQKQSLLHLQNKLEATQKKLNKTSGIKNNLINNVSYKIRDNISTIFNISEILKAGNHTPEQSQYFDNIYDSCLYLSTVMDDVADLLKVESGQLKVAENIFDFHKLIKDTCISYASQTNKKGCDLKFNIEKETPQYIIVDGYRVKQIISNTIDHILSETEGVYVSIDVSNKEQHANRTELEIIIQSDKCKLTAQKRDKLNKLFHEVQREDFYVNDDISINLKLAVQLTNLLEGDYKLDITEDGSCVFIITLMAKHAQPPKAVQDIIKKIQYIREHKSHLKILLVEDNIVNQKVAISHLKSLNFQNVQTADNGADAISQSKREDFDIIFMDCELPDIDGFEATQKIRAREADSGKRTPIIAITAHNRANNKDICLKAGMDDYISKPYTMEKFVEKINKWLI